jgi:hypothetical protein
MTPGRQQINQETWRAVEPPGHHFVELAAKRVFDIASQTQLASTFDSTLTPDICDRIAATIGELVVAIDEPKRFVPLAVRPGRRNPTHGIDHRLYGAMGCERGCLTRRRGRTATAGW